MANNKQPLDWYNYYAGIARYELPSSMIKDKMITQVTCYIKGKKWVWNKTFEKWKKEAKDPLRPEKMAEDTMWITKYKNVITMRYKEPFIYKNNEKK
jgi:hypothetical protein